MATIDAITISRAAQLLFSLIALGLNASIVDWFNKHQSVTLPAYASFLVFNSVWTILVVLPYTTFCPRYFPKYINRYSSLAIELTTTIFWFCGFIAGAAWLGIVDRCGGLLCNNARAGVVFAALIFVCCLVTSYYPIKYTFFDREDGAFGEQNHTLGISGALKAKNWQLKQSGSSQHHEKDTMQDGRAFSKFTGSIEKSMHSTQTRMGNILRGLKEKTGRSESPDQYTNRSEMSQHTRSDNMV